MVSADRLKKLISLLRQHSVDVSFLRMATGAGALSRSANALTIPSNLRVVSCYVGSVQTSECSRPGQNGVTPMLGFRDLLKDIHLLDV